MRAFWKAAAATAVLGASAVVLGPAPAGAAIGISVSGSTVTITMTGNGTVHFVCSAPSNGYLQVNGNPTSPSVLCSALSKVTVNGDGGEQLVFGNDLSKPVFSANPYLVASTGAGHDYVNETDRADSIDTGADYDQLGLFPPGITNTLLQAGSGEDEVAVVGSNGNDTINAASSTATLGITASTPTGSSSYSVLNVERITVNGNGGDDAVSTGGITGTSNTTKSYLWGGDGNDTLTLSSVGDYINGGTGTNTLNGGSDQETIRSESDTDTINPGAGINRVYDGVSPRSGDRTVANDGDLIWYLDQFPGDSVARVRQGPSPNTVKLTSSLSRPGQQDLGNAIASVNIEVDQKEEPASRALVDVVSGVGPNTYVVGDGGDGQLVDFTVTSGGWTTAGTPGDAYTITTTAVGAGDLAVEGISNISVHGPWPNANRSFAWRITRDLLFRFPSPAVVSDRETKLGNGTTTRAAITASLMDTDEYRGLDVDRVFLKFLRRTSDPSGRSYWIGSLRSGKSLLQFRAQLFGSNEYFTKAGGTNAAFMVKAYQDVMGRAPDAGGQAYWTNKLNGGADRGAVAREFLKSTEARRNIAKEQFLRFLDRFPTTEEAATWVTNLAGPQGEQQLIAFLANSSAYHARS